MQIIKGCLFLAFAILLSTFIAGCGQNLVPISMSLEISAQNITEASTLTLTAKTEGSALAKVVFYDGTTKLGEDESVPYSFDVKLTPAENGEHTYRSVAMDGVNNSLAVTEQKVRVEIPQSATSLPAEVVSVSPADGARGVKKDAPIIVSFSAAPDRKTVESSYQSDSEGIKLAEVEFLWNQAGTELTIRPKQPLGYLESNIMYTSLNNDIWEAINKAPRKNYSYNLLGKNYSFSTARLLRQTFPGGSFTALPGGYGYSCAPDRSYYYMCIGDLADNTVIRLFTDFDWTMAEFLSDLQPDDLMSADFEVNVLGNPDGNPDSTTKTFPLILTECGKIGCAAIVAETVRDPYTPQDYSTYARFYNSPALRSWVYIYDNSMHPSPIRADLKDEVRQWALDHSSPVQVRVRMFRGSNGDGQQNLAYLFPASILTVGYLSP